MSETEIDFYLKKLKEENNSLSINLDKALKEKYDISNRVKLNKIILN
jgi:hypothetical protein